MQEGHSQWPNMLVQKEVLWRQQQTRCGAVHAKKTTTQTKCVGQRKRRTKMEPEEFNSMISVQFNANGLIRSAMASDLLYWFQDENLYHWNSIRKNNALSFTQEHSLKVGRNIMSMSFDLRLNFTEKCTKAIQKCGEYQIKHGTEANSIIILCLKTGTKKYNWALPHTSLLLSVLFPLVCLYFLPSALSCLFSLLLPHVFFNTAKN